eukprot:3836170-Amphidinium_carterae.1
MADRLSPSGRHVVDDFDDAVIRDWEVLSQRAALGAGEIPPLPSLQPQLFGGSVGARPGSGGSRPGSAGARPAAVLSSLHNQDV